MRQGKIAWVIILGVATLGAPHATHAQVGEQRSETIPLAIDSGLHDNPSPYTELVFETTIDAGDVAWFRLIFDDAQLAEGSYIRITSFQDGAVQELDAVAIQQWRKTTAYFNGGVARLALFAGPRTHANSFRTSSAIVGAPPGPMPETLCDGNDERVPDDRDGIARMVTLALTGPCSATIVSDSGCFFSAGHCAGILGLAQFNVPLSNANGTMQHPGPEDQYIVDPSSVQSLNGGVGNDYAIFSCFPNTQTGFTPLEGEGGTFYPLAEALPPIGTIVRVTGFGLDNGPADNSQQTDTGEYLGLFGTTIRHRADTTGGNSGSSIIIDATDEVIGIHTHGGCDLDPETFNSGTSITHPALQSNALCCLPPEFLANPQSVTGCMGAGVELSVVVQGADFQLQWQHDGVDIPGATTDTYTIPSLDVQDAGQYRCIATGCATTNSATATVAVVAGIEVTQHPASEMHNVGDSVFLTVSANGGTIDFQWRQDGIPIPGATGFFLALSNVQCDDAGAYDVTMINECNDTAISNPGILTISPCALPNGDADADGDIDLQDFTAYFDCVQGPNVPVAPPCDIFDFDADTDIDHHDFASFQSAFTGP